MAYFAIDLGHDSAIATIRLQNALLGIGTAFAMLGIGTGIVHWAKALMPDHEVSEERHAIRTEEDRQAAVRIVDDIVEETGIKRRPLIRNTLLGAVALAPLPAIWPSSVTSVPDRTTSWRTRCGHRPRTAGSSGSPATPMAPPSRPRTSPSAPPSTSSRKG